MARRIVKASTRKKIARELKKYWRKKVGVKTKTKVSTPKTKKSADLSAYMTGKSSVLNKRTSKTRQGNLQERASRGGFTGYTPVYKSKQNKYTQNLREVLKNAGA